jgi:hypothetical protein
MSRPEHVPCVNTPEGIYRINELQRHYDEDPERYEEEEQRQEEVAYMLEIERQCEEENQYND